MGEDETSVRYFLSSVYESAEYVYNITINCPINKEFIYTVYKQSSSFQKINGPY